MRFITCWRASWWRSVVTTRLDGLASSVKPLFFFFPLSLLLLFPPAAAASTPGAEAAELDAEWAGVSWGMGCTAPLASVQLAAAGWSASSPELVLRWPPLTATEAVSGV